MSDDHTGSGRDSGSGSPRPDRPQSQDFQSSVSRLERAVDDLVTKARSEFSGRATAFMDDTSDRLERESGRRGKRSEVPPADRYEDVEVIARRLYRDPTHQKIGGVCAGLARYYGVERWVVRCIAVTGLLFFPTIVFPAYWIAYFVMDKPARSGEEPRRSRRRRRRERHGRDDHRSPTPELGPRLSPRYSLRNVQADLTEVELRLRRMETHVTSGQYELQRELHKIDGGGS